MTRPLHGGDSELGREHASRTLGKRTLHAACQLAMFVIAVGAAAVALLRLVASPCDLNLLDWSMEHLERLRDGSPGREHEQLHDEVGEVAEVPPRQL